MVFKPKDRFIYILNFTSLLTHIRKDNHVCFFYKETNFFIILNSTTKASCFFKKSYLRIANLYKHQIDQAVSPSDKAIDGLQYL